MKRNFNDVILIRRAKNKDVRAIYSFICELSGLKLDYEKFKQAYNTNLENPEMIYLVADHSSEVVGFVSCVSHLRLRDGGDRVGEIKDMYVLPYMRTLGIEHLLLEKLSIVAKTKGMIRVDVNLDLAPDDDDIESDSDRIAGE